MTRRTRLSEPSESAFLAVQSRIDAVYKEPRLVARRTAIGATSSYKSAYTTALSAQCGLVRSTPMVDHLLLLAWLTFAAVLDM
jgi:hypothetical protein